MRLGKIGNIVIRVYGDDTRKHRRPHFHAIGPDDNIVVGIPQLDVIEGSIGQRGRERVLEWAREHMEELVDARNRGNPTMPVIRS